MSQFRKAVRNGLVAALVNKTDAADRVYGNRQDAMRKQKLPVILVMHQEEATERWTETPLQYKRMARFVIWGALDATITNVEDKLDDLGSQIEAALHADGVLDGIDGEPVTIESVVTDNSGEGDRMYGEIGITVLAPFYEVLPAEEDLPAWLQTHIDWELAPADADLEAEDTIEHLANPRVFFDPGDMPTLRAKALTDLVGEAGRLTEHGDVMFQSMASKLPEFDEADMPTTQKEWRRYGDRLMGIAGSWLVSHNDRERLNFKLWATTAMDRLTDYALWGPSADEDVDLAGAHMLLGFGMAYDILWPDLTADQRKRYAQRIRDQVDNFTDAIDGGPGGVRWVGSYNGNINHVCHFAIMVGALAVKPVWPSWFDGVMTRVTDNMAKVVQIRTARGEATMHEGMGYASLDLHALTSIFELLKRHGYTDYTTSDELRDQIEGIFHGSALNFQKVLGYADNDGTFYHGPQHLLRWLGAKFNDGRAQWLADHLWGTSYGDQHDTGNPEGSTILLEYLFKDTSLAPVEITTTNTPGFRWFEDLGLVSWRRGWAEGDTQASFIAGDPTGSAVWALTMAGDPLMDVPGGSHIHPAAGQLIFWPSGSQLAGGNLYTYPKRTALNNTVTFSPLDDFVPELTDAELAVVWEPSAEAQIGQRGEVGQVGEWNQWFGPVNKLISEAVSADMIHAEAEDDGFFAVAEIAEAYPSTLDLTAGGTTPFGLDRLMRAVVILQEDVAIVLDHVETSKALPYNAYWRLTHLPAAPAAISVNANVGTMTSSGVSHTIEAAHPAGLTLSTDREIYNIEDATGVNDREITDWDLLAAYSKYLRVTDSSLNGTQDYVYVMTPNGVTSSVISVDDTDPLGVVIRITVGSITYRIKICTDLDATDRLTFLGIPDAYHLVEVE